MSDGPGQARWQAAWLRGAQRRGLMAGLLWPVSLFYRGLIALRRRLYVAGLFKVHRLDVPVIVVGNVIVGGAGKTPCTIALVNHLQSQGWHPGVVSRGHGRRGTDVVHVKPDTPASDAGDEPLLIQHRTGAPVCVAARRVDAARALLAAHPQVNVLVCDDGLQHLALGRQLAVVVFDDRGTGNGCLLPAGLLREPWPPQAGAPFQPDLVLRQRRDGGPGAPIASPGLPVFDAVRRLADHALGPQGQGMPLARLRGQALTAVAAIARPQVFFEMLRDRGLTPVQERALPDHADAAAYAALLREATHPLVCTEKDAVKLFPLLPGGPSDLPVKAWAVPLELVPDPAFFAAIDARLAAFKPGR
jgi:tetraacyldisaccharide 4'-kinase